MLDQESIHIAIVSSYGKDLFVPEKLYDQVIDTPWLSWIDASRETRSGWRTMHNQGRQWRKPLGRELRLVDIDFLLGRNKVKVVQL